MAVVEQIMEESVLEQLGEGVIELEVAKKQGPYNLEHSLQMGEKLNTLILNYEAT